MIFEEQYLSCYILLPDQIAMSDCLYFVKYWALCVLSLFVNQVVTPQILKLKQLQPYLSNQALLST